MGKQLNVENSVISAKDDALFYNAMIQKNGVWQYGNKLDHEIISANQINIKDGMVTAQGRNYVIYPNEVDSLTIENGTVNTKRNDLIVYEVSKTSEGEHVGLKVIKGTNATTPVDPTLIQDDTLSSGSIYQMPLYRVRLNGINIEGVDDLRDYIVSFGNLSKSNLLINGDFKINQRGLSEYAPTKTSYTVDRWKVTNVLTVKVEGDGIVVTNNSDSVTGYIQQIFETPLGDGTYTGVISAENVTGQVRYYMDGTTVTQCYLKNGVNVLYETGNPTKYNIALEPSSSVKLKYCDLFRGNVAYSHNPRLYAEELEMCKRYYAEETLYMPKIFSYSSTNKYKFGGNYITQKRGSCTLSLVKAQVYNSSESFLEVTTGTFTVTTSHGTCLVITTPSAIDDGAQCCRATIVIDSEIY